MQHLSKEDKKYLKNVEDRYFSGKNLKESMNNASRSLSSKARRKVSEWIIRNLS